MVLLLLKTLKTFNSIHPLNLLTEMGSRGEIFLLRVIQCVWQAGLEPYSQQTLSPLSLPWP